MRKLNALISILVIAAAILSFACTGMNYGALYGGANTHPAPNYGNTLAFNQGGGLLHFNTVPGQVGLNAGEARKVGDACSMSILYLVGIGDSSIETAKKNGNITKVASVEHKIVAILGVLWHQHCTVVRGS